MAARRFANGGIKVLNSETLQELHNFKYSKSGVVQCAFSHDCAYLATSDQDFCIAIYRCEAGHNCLKGGFARRRVIRVLNS